VWDWGRELVGLKAVDLDNSLRGWGHIFSLHERIEPGKETE